MAFLFQDQNQGTRNDFDHAQTREAAATVLFHPDYNRRLRNHTESADPSSPSEKAKKALAGLGYVTLTAGGDFRPALRTSAARNGRPRDEYDQTPTGGQASLASGIGMSPCPRNRACLFLTRFLHANRGPPSDQVRGHASPRKRYGRPNAFTQVAAIGIALSPTRARQHESSPPQLSQPRRQRDRRSRNSAAGARARLSDAPDAHHRRFRRRRRRRHHRAPPRPGAGPI